MMEVRGVAAVKGGTRVNHLLFADDYVILSRASPVEWCKIQDILKLYEAAFAQAVN